SPSLHRDIDGKTSGCHAACAGLYHANDGFCVPFLDASERQSRDRDGDAATCRPCRKNDRYGLSESVQTPSGTIGKSTAACCTVPSIPQARETRSVWAARSVS